MIAHGDKKSVARLGDLQRAVNFRANLMSGAEGQGAAVYCAADKDMGFAEAVGHGFQGNSRLEYKAISTDCVQVINENGLVPV